MLSKVIDWGESFVKWIYSYLHKNKMHKEIKKNSPHIIALIRSKLLLHRTYYFFLSNWDCIMREVDGTKWVALYANKNWDIRKQECDFLIEKHLLTRVDAPIQVDQGVKLGYFVSDELINICKRR